jgi:hypothetical protein
LDGRPSSFLTTKSAFGVPRLGSGCRRRRLAFHRNMDAQSPMGQPLEIAGRELWSPWTWNEFSSEENCAHWLVALHWFFFLFYGASNQPKQVDDD